MYNILKTLSESQTALDLGCGNGSFDYNSCRCKMIGIDIIFLNPAELCRDGDRMQYIRSSADQTPLADGSIDAVICHHSMEHFSSYSRTLDEIHRVLKPTGMLWLADPDGYSFDDALYRFTDAGHSHVNRFRLERLIQETGGCPRMWEPVPHRRPSRILPEAASHVGGRGRCPKDASHIRRALQLAGQISEPRYVSVFMKSSIQQRRQQVPK